MADLVGQVFGRWTVLSRAQGSRYQCECSCGSVKAIHQSNLTSGRSKSCGCYHRERLRKHGAARTPLYTVWRAILARCNRPSCKAWQWYGRRGVQCRFQSFEEFRDALGDPPGPGWTVDRIDNNGHYEASNIRWATWQEQSRNTRRNRILTFNGKSQPMADWSKELGLARGILAARLKRGWSVERALTTPSLHNNRRPN